MLLNAKAWVKIWLFSVIIMPVLVGIFNYLLDPFHYYRLTAFYPIAYDNERTMNSGLIKHSTYDSIILGTSMVENFQSLQVEKILHYKKVLKLPLEGASAKEESIVLKSVLLKNKKLKHVLWGLDVFSFAGDPDYIKNKSAFPIYLYDNNQLNDYKYIFSFDTLLKSFNAYKQQFKFSQNNPIFDKSKMYEWQYVWKNNFTLQNVLTHWKERNKFMEVPIEKQKITFLKDSFKINFLAILKSNPSIQFTIFFPPYSILTYKVLEERGLLNDTLKFKKYIFESTKDLKNIKIYDFQIATKIIKNLHNYKDLSHYHQKINKWMLHQITQNNFLVTQKNLDIYINKLSKETRDYNVTKELLLH